MHFQNNGGVVSQPFDPETSFLGSTTVRIRVWDTQGRLLLVEERPRNEIKGKGRGKQITKKQAFGLPGGGLEPFEEVFEGAARELYEETGLTADFEFDYTQELREGDGTYDHRIIIIEAVNPRGELKPQDPDGNIIAALWFDRRELHGIKEKMADETLRHSIVPIYKRHLGFIFEPPPGYRVP